MNIIGSVKPFVFPIEMEWNSTYFHMWDDIVSNDPDRLINIYPPDAMRYTELLRNIFENICIWLYL